MLNVTKINYSGSDSRSLKHHLLSHAELNGLICHRSTLLALVFAKTPTQQRQKSHWKRKRGHSSIAWIQAVLIGLAFLFREDVARLVECLPRSLRPWLPSSARIKPAVVIYTSRWTAGGAERQGHAPPRRKFKASLASSRPA